MKFKKCKGILILTFSFLLFFAGNNKVLATGTKGFDVNVVEGTTSTNNPCGTGTCARHIVKYGKRIFGLKVILLNNEGNLVNEEYLWDDYYNPGGSITTYGFEEKYMDQTDGKPAYKMVDWANNLNRDKIEKLLIEGLGENKEQINSYFSGSYMLIVEPIFGIAVSVNGNVKKYTGTVSEIAKAMRDYAKTKKTFNAECSYTFASFPYKTDFYKTKQYYKREYCQINGPWNVLMDYYKAYNFTLNVKKYQLSDCTDALTCAEKEPLKNGKVLINLKNYAPKTCKTELKRIIPESNGNTYYGKITLVDQRAELYNLYYNNPDGKYYNLLLNFDNYDGQGISCGNFNEGKLNDKDKNNNFICDPKLDFKSSSNRGHYYWYLSSANSSDITVGSSTVKCKYTVSTSNSIIYNKVFTNAGTSIWTTKKDENVFETKITKTCTGYNVGDAAKTKIQKQMKDESYELSLSGTNYYGGENAKIFKLKYIGASKGDVTVLKDGVEYEASVTTTYAWKYGQDNTIYYKKSDGSFVNNLGATADKSNYVGPDYGFPTEINKDGGEVDFKLNLPAEVKTFFGIKSDLKTTCKYKTQIPGKEIEVKEKLNVNFRIIKTSTGSEAFPGYNGKGRNTGFNWCLYKGTDEDGKDVILNSKEVVRHNLYKKCKEEAGTDNDVLKACKDKYYDGISITNSDDTCNNSNDIVIKEIVNSNNSYNSKNETPLISLTLNASNIKEIREYNKETTYDDWDLKCNSGEDCISDFVSTLLTGSKYASINVSSCEKGSNRKYCVGGNL